MSTQPTSLLDGELIDMKFITRLTKLTDKWFYALIQKGEFPEPIKLGRSSRWYKCEVEKWLEKRLENQENNHLLFFLLSSTYPLIKLFHFNHTYHVNS